MSDPCLPVGRPAPGLERDERVLRWRREGRRMAWIARELSISRGRAQQLYARASRRRRLEAAWEERQKREGVLAPDQRSVAALGLTARIYNALVRGGVRTVGHLSTMSDAEVLRMRDVGPGTLAILRHALAEMDGDVPTAQAVTQTVGGAAKRRTEQTPLPAEGNKPTGACAS